MSNHREWAHIRNGGIFLSYSKQAKKIGTSLLESPVDFSSNNGVLREHLWSHRVDAHYPSIGLPKRKLRHMTPDVSSTHRSPCDARGVTD